MGAAGIAYTVSMTTSLFESSARRAGLRPAEDRSTATPWTNHGVSVRRSRQKNLLVPRGMIGGAP